MALELASVSRMISEILIKIGLKMTIFIHKFFGISLDASTVSLYNRAPIGFHGFKQNFGPRVLGCVKPYTVVPKVLESFLCGPNPIHWT